MADGLTFDELPKVDEQGGLSFDDLPKGGKMGPVEAGLRTAASGALPGIGFAGGFTVGAEIGAPSAPFTFGLGPIATGLVGGIAASALTSYAQRKVLQQSEAGKEFLQKEAQAQQEQPAASFAGEILSGLPGFKFAPGTVFKGLKALPSVIRGTATEAQAAAALKAGAQVGAGTALSAIQPLIFEQRAPTLRDLAAGATFASIYGEPRFKLPSITGRGAPAATTTQEQDAIHSKGPPVLPVVPPQPGEGAGKVPTEKGGTKVTSPREVAVEIARSLTDTELKVAYAQHITKILDFGARGEQVPPELQAVSGLLLDELKRRGIELTTPEEGKKERPSEAEPAEPIVLGTELTRNSETLSQVFVKFVKGEQLSPIEIALVQRLNREDPAAYRYLMQLALLRPAGMNELNARIAEADARLEKILALKKEADPIDAKLARGETLTEAERIRREQIRQLTLELGAEMQQRGGVDAPAPAVSPVEAVETGVRPPESEWIQIGPPSETRRAEIEHELGIWNEELGRNVSDVVKGAIGRHIERLKDELQGRRRVLPPPASPGASASPAAPAKPAELTLGEVGDDVAHPIIGQELFSRKQEAPGKPAVVTPLKIRVIRRGEDTGHGSQTINVIWTDDVITNVNAGKQARGKVISLDDAIKKAMKQRGAEAVPPERPPEEEWLPDVDLSGLPQPVRDVIENRYAIAKSLRAVNSIIRQIIQGRVAADVQVEGAPGKAEALAIVKAVRAKKGIPSQDDRAEWQAWLAKLPEALREREKPETPQSRSLERQAKLKALVDELNELSNKDNRTEEENRRMAALHGEVDKLYAELRAPQHPATTTSPYRKAQQEIRKALDEELQSIDEAIGTYGPQDKWDLATIRKVRELNQRKEHLLGTIEHLKKLVGKPEPLPESRPFRWWPGLRELYPGRYGEFRAKALHIRQERVKIERKKTLTNDDLLRLQELNVKEGILHDELEKFTRHAAEKEAKAEEERQKKLTPEEKKAETKERANWRKLIPNLVQQIEDARNMDDAIAAMQRILESEKEGLIDFEQSDAMQKMLKSRIRRSKQGKLGLLFARFPEELHRKPAIASEPEAPKVPESPKPPDKKKEKQSKLIGNLYQAIRTGTTPQQFLVVQRKLAEAKGKTLSNEQYMELIGLLTRKWTHDTNSGPIGLSESILKDFPELRELSERYAGLETKAVKPAEKSPAAVEEPKLLTEEQKKANPLWFLEELPPKQVRIFRELESRIATFQPQARLEALQHVELNNTRTEDRGMARLEIKFETGTQNPSEADVTAKLAANKRYNEALVAMLKHLASLEPPTRPGKRRRGHGDIGDYGDMVTGLPPGVPDRGPTFKEEIYAAARRLMNDIRSKVNMRPGLLGYWKRIMASDHDAIFVRDVDNQRTMAHELGHGIDAEIFANNGALKFSKDSLMERIGRPPGVTKHELFNELKAVSELMRGPIQGTKAQIAYRKRASELIADYFSLYVHDAARARSMAPKWTAGFERVLNAHPDADVPRTVAELVAGNVKPAAPERPMGGVTTRAVEVPEKIELTTPGKAPPREKELAVAAEDIVTEAPRMLRAQEAIARTLERAWRKLVPNHQDRLTVGAFLEGIGNITILGDTIDAVKSRMTEAMYRLEKAYSHAIEKQRQHINEYLLGTEEDEYLAFLPDYLTHIYTDSKTKIEAAMARWARESPNAKKRVLPTLKEGVELNLTPRSQDPATLYSLYAYVNWRVATNLKAVAKLFELKMADGSPAIVPQKDAPEGWHVTDNPLLQRIYARKAGDKTMLWRGGVAIHPDVWRAARQLFERPVSSNLMEVYDSINSFMRANAFAFTMFHHATISAAATGVMMQAHNPIRAFFRILERDPISGERKLFQFGPALGKRMMNLERFVAPPLLDGMTLAHSESESYQRTALDTMQKWAARTKDWPYVGRLTAAIRDVQEWWQRQLWEGLHDSMKVLAYWDLRQRWMESAPEGTNPQEASRQIASLLNDVFGGQEWETKFWLSPGARKAMSRVLLAPDWTLSTLRTVPGLSDIASLANSKVPWGRAAPAHYTGGNARRLKFWGGEMLALTMGTLAAQWAIYQAFGDKDKGDHEWMWDNEPDPTNDLDARTRIDITPIVRMAPWHDQNDSSRYYANLGKRPGEVLRWFMHPMGELENKLSRPVAEFVKQLTGMEGNFETPWKRDHDSFLESLPERSLSVGKQFLPFTFSGIFSENSTSFLFSLPTSKGMTKFKTMQALEDVFRLQAEPTLAKEIWHGYPLAAIRGKDIGDMVDQITDAAIANGVNPIPLRTRALSIMRGKYYDQLFKAIQNEDETKIEKAVQGLLNLGATTRGLNESFKAKMQLELPQ